MQFLYSKVVHSKVKELQLQMICLPSRGSPLLSALESFHNNSCLLEIRRVGYLDTHVFSPGVIYCSVLVKKCPGAYLTHWRYIVPVINSNQDHALYSVKSY